MSTDLWITKYRPQTLDEFVWRDPDMRTKVEEWIKEGALPHLLFSGTSGTGKAQPLDAKILTPTGWVLMGELKFGDKILTPSGRISNIIGIFPQGEKEVFKIDFDDGKSVECCEEHLWEVYHNDWRKNSESFGRKILPTDAIKTKLEQLKKHKSNHRLCIRLIDPVYEGNDIDLPIQPYALGSLLGDGCLREQGSIMFSSDDGENVNNLSKSLGDNFEVNKSGHCDYRVIQNKVERNYVTEKGTFNNPLKAALSKLNLLGKKSPEKFIPRIYMSSSVKQRFALIQGLMDTDGTVTSPKTDFTKGGSVSFCTTSLQLAKDLQELIWSLGGIAKISPKQTWYTYKEEKKQGLPSYQLNIRFKEPQKLFKLKRKINRCPENYQYMGSLCNYIKDITSLGITKPMQCITIDDSEHLYITNDFVSTHNSSLAWLLLKELNISDNDMLFIPASRERGIDALQDKIINFVSAWAFNESGIKYIFFDEADRLSPLAQDMLRTESETYDKVCRFILTANHPSKIRPALHSRLQEIKFSALDRDSFILRAAEVLVQENVEFVEEDLLIYTDKTYPDLRKCLGILQQNTINSILSPLKDDVETTKDYLVDAVAFFKKGKYLEGRKLIIERADIEEYDSIYRFFYQNLDLFGKSQRDQDEALKLIRNGIVNDSRVADKELNLAACMAELCMIGQPDGI